MRQSTLLFYLGNTFINALIYFNALGVSRFAKSVDLSPCPLSSVGAEPLHGRACV